VEYQVEFDTNGSSDQVPGQEVEYPDTAMEPTREPQRSHYRFAGWFVDPDLTEQYDFTAPVTGDVQLYAKWDPEQYIVRFDLGFDLGGGAATVPEQTVEYQAVAVAPEPPLRPHFTFAGWFTDLADATTEYDFATPVEADLTLYAKWVEDARCQYDSALYADDALCVAPPVPPELPPGVPNTALWLRQVSVVVWPTLLGLGLLMGGGWLIWRRRRS
jgi:uncharacterized repeat protein (TIGR02543 family)/LPXTG-motif cell wall-anchored protein